MEPGKRDRTGDACSKACRNGTRPSSQPARILATRQYTVVPAILGQSAQGGLSLALALATAWLTFSIPIFPAGSRFVVVGKISLESCTTSGCRYGIASCFKVQQQPILKGRIAYCQSVTITLQRPHVQFGKIGFRPRVPVNDQPSFICPRKAAFAQTATHPRQHGTRCIGTVRTRNPLDMDTLCQLLDDLEIFRFGQGAFSSNHKPFVESACALGAATWSLSPCHEPTVNFPSPIADAGLRRRSKCEVCRLCGLQDTLCANPCRTARP